MKRFQHLLNRYWGTGLCLAVAGVVLARVIAPGFQPRTTAILASTGQFVALAGLLVIALGIRRRVFRSSTENVGAERPLS